MDGKADVSRKMRTRMPLVCRPMSTGVIIHIVTPLETGKSWRSNRFWDGFYFLSSDVAVDIIIYNNERVVSHRYLWI